ncbi:MAG: DUF2007 domain-containing protein [Chlorobi bacterium]|nr:DUF2007 domain-containing protein [Chlorobiota bacterium]
MEKGWVVIFSTNQIYKSEILKDVLENNNIDCVVLNKRDSSYLNFGNIEILVRKEDIIPAKHLINKADL